MPSLPKLRLVWVALSVLFLGAFIWFAGPYFAFASYQPLQPVISRVTAIALLTVGWVVGAAIKHRRTTRATQRLMAAVVEQEHAIPSRADADVEQLRERFKEAVAELEQKKTTGHGLYDIPWYVMIGAPGAGKTTALVNSGLRFPVKQRTGRAAVPGVGGTRDCDWWFTDDAVLLDTAGRYTTQDSDSSVDQAGWAGFLDLLCKYRTRRPINGVLLTISAEDLMVHGPTELERHATAMRRRLQELNTKLEIRLPVYLLVTKCDLVAGFSEYFDDLTQDDRAQVWGTTFAYDPGGSSDGSRGLPEELDALVSRLNARVLGRVEQERDPRRRLAIFAFPQQMAALRDTVTTFVGEVFGSTRFDGQVMLRGVYFTSGTQEGTPIDRLLGAVRRRFGINPHAPDREGRGKAFFIERLLKDVVFAESGIAGVRPRLEFQTAAWQLGVYVCLGLVAIGGVTGLAASYLRNREYIAEVQGAVTQLAATPTAVADAGWAPEVVLPRLDAVRALSDSANRFEAAPWSMRWGLYQGSSLGRAARDAYVRELDGSLLPYVHAQIERRLNDGQTSELLLYEYLKTYVMLGQPEHLDKAQLEILARDEWRRGVPETSDRLDTHFGSYLTLEATPRAMPLDDAVLASARNSIESVSLPGIMYSRLRLAYAEDEDRAVQLDRAAGPGVAEVFRRTSGKSLSESVNALFTADVFQEVSSQGTAELVASYSTEDWVWGDHSGVPRPNQAGLAAALLDLYEQSYIETWNTIVSDLALVPANTQSEVETVLARLSAPTSPLRGMLETVDAHTFLVDPVTDNSDPGFLRSALDRARQVAGYEGDAAAGQAITDHFQPIHELVADGLGHVDDILDQLGAIHQQMTRIGPDTGRIPPGDPAYPVVVEQIRVLVDSLRLTSEGLPPALGAAVAEAGDRAVAASGVGSVARQLYRREVLPLCQAATGRYPFTAGATAEVTLDEFGQLFGNGGLYDRFFAQQLESFVDRSRGAWRWRPGSGVGGGETLLRQFEQAQRIRTVFFATGATPRVPFTLQFGELDMPAREFTLEVDGQSLQYVRGSPRRPSPMMWPGPEPGRVAYSFEQTQYDQSDGDWAWFRRFEGPFAQRESDVATLLTFRAGPRQATVRAGAVGTRNLFTGLDVVRQFRCTS